LKPATEEAVRLFQDGQITLAQVEANGIKIDTEYLAGAISSTEEKIRKLQSQIKEDEVYKLWRKRFGKKANIGSNEQLGKLLFDELGYKSKNLTATGKYKVDVDALTGIDLPFVKQWIEIEKLKKANSTFLKGIEREVDDRGFLHPFFNLHIARTFRSSSDSPNLQNMPIRDKGIGEVIRRCFIPRHPSRQIVEIDFAGIEVRVAACYNKDPVLIDYIRNSPPKDMHRDMAAQLFCCKPEQVSKDMRHLGKNQFVFPQFYGSYYLQCAMAIWNMSELGQFKMADGTDVFEHLAEKGIHKLGKCDPESSPKIGTFEHHVQKVEHDFWNNRFHVYNGWKKKWWSKFQELGYFRMKTGFVCHGLLNRKEVTNYGIQGSAFHCLLWSLIEIQKEIKKRKMKTKLIGQIHDSVLADTHRRERDDYIHMAKQIMTQRLVKHWTWLVVPLEVEAEAAPPGASWFEKEVVAI
jgi:DNA polymerase I